ncbi:MAG TPA: hypothetical protein VL359_11895 [bacterium]|nr:hypothetical protein [bacterium]
MDWTGIVSTIAGGAGGGILRLLPEAVAMWKDYQARKQDQADKAHELEIMKLQIEAQKVAGAQRLEEIRTQGDVDTVLEQIKGAIDVTKPTGIKFIDVLNGSVRPVVTYWFFALYAVVKLAAIYTSLAAGGDVLQALSNAWLPQDSATLFGILSFWFLGRVIDKREEK